MPETHANRGRALELAVARQAREYRRQGRAVLVRQRTPQATAGDGRVVHAAAAPVDFLGARVGGRALAVEAKQESGMSLALSRFDDDQRAALAALHLMSAEVVVLVAFEALGETYSIMWSTLAGFLAAPWRASLSPTWCRAHGLLVPEVERDSLRRRRCLFLDAAPHPQIESAGVEVAAEQARAEALARPPEPLVLEVSTQPPSAYAGLSTEQIRDRLVDAVNTGIDRQLRRQRRNPSHGPGGRGGPVRTSTPWSRR